MTSSETVRAIQNIGPLERCEDLLVQVSSAFNQIAQELETPLLLSVPVMLLSVGLFFWTEFGGD